MNFRNSFFIIFLLVFQTLEAQKIIRTPFLQKPGKTSMTIKWRTDLPTETKLKYRLSDNPIQWNEAFLPGFRTDHEISLAGLAPGTWYAYALMNGNSVLAENPGMKFRTSPEAGDTDPIVIWAMGDFGDLSQQKYVENQRNVKNAFLSKTPEPLDLWLWLGDNSYCCGTDPQYQTGAFDFYEARIFNATPVMPVPGNHEYQATPTAQSDRNIPYYNIFSLPVAGESGGLASGSQSYYSYDYGNVHFIALDSYGLENGKRLSDPQSSQNKWLERDLKQNSQLWTIVYFHHPPYTLLGHISDATQELRDIRLNLIPLFDAYGVDLVLNGHSHDYERTRLIKNHRYGSETWRDEFHLAQPGSGNYLRGEKPYLNKTEGTVYAVVGSAGRIDWNGINGQLPSVIYQNKDIGGSLKIVVNDNRMDAFWIAADGEVKDSFSFFKKVNISKTVDAPWGEPVTLSASWIGDYEWADGSAQRAVTVSPKRDTLLSVHDLYGHLKDEFLLKVTPQPELQTLLSTENACSGGEIIVNYHLSNADMIGKSVVLEIWSEKGKEEEQAIGSFPYRYMVPENAVGMYTLRLKVIEKEYRLISKNVLVDRRAKVRLSNAGTISYAAEVLLNLEVSEGSLPVDIEVNDSLQLKLTNKISEVKVPTSTERTFEITKVTNICGVGVFDPARIQMLAPLSSEETLVVKVFPNPARGYVDVFFPDNSIPNTVQLNSLDGKKLLEQTSRASSLRIDLSPYPGGIYLIRAAGKKFRLVID